MTIFTDQAHWYFGMAEAPRDQPILVNDLDGSESYITRWTEDVYAEWTGWYSGRGGTENRPVMDRPLAWRYLPPPPLARKLKNINAYEIEGGTIVPSINLAC